MRMIKGFKAKVLLPELDSIECNIKYVITQNTDTRCPASNVSLHKSLIEIYVLFLSWYFLASFEIIRFHHVYNIHQSIRRHNS